MANRKNILKELKKKKNRAKKQHLKKERKKALLVKKKKKIPNPFMIKRELEMSDELIELLKEMLKDIQDGKYKRVIDNASKYEKYKWFLQKMTTELKIYQLEEFLDNYLNGQKRVYQTVKDDEGNDKKMYIKKDLRKVYTINEYFEYFLNKIQNMKVDVLELMEKDELERDDEIQVGNLNIDNKVYFVENDIPLREHDIFQKRKKMKEKIVLNEESDENNDEDMGDAEYREKKRKREKKILEKNLSDMIDKDDNKYLEDVILEEETEKPKKKIQKIKILPNNFKQIDYSSLRGIKKTLKERNIEFSIPSELEERLKKARKDKNKEKVKEIEKDIYNVLLPLVTQIEESDNEEIEEYNKDREKEINDFKQEQQIRKDLEKNLLEAYNSNDKKKIEDAKENLSKYYKGLIGGEEEIIKLKQKIRNENDEDLKQELKDKKEGIENYKIKEELRKIQLKRKLPYIKFNNEILELEKIKPWLDKYRFSIVKIEESDPPNISLKDAFFVNKKNILKGDYARDNGWYIANNYFDKLISVNNRNKPVFGSDKDVTVKYYDNSRKQLVQITVNIINVLDLNTITNNTFPIEIIIQNDKDEIFNKEYKGINFDRNVRDLREKYLEKRTLSIEGRIDKFSKNILEDFNTQFIRDHAISILTSSLDKYFNNDDIRYIEDEIFNRQKNRPVNQYLENIVKIKYILSNEILKKNIVKLLLQKRLIPYHFVVMNEKFLLPEIYSNPKISDNQRDIITNFIKNQVEENTKKSIINIYKKLNPNMKYIIKRNIMKDALKPELPYEFVKELTEEEELFEEDPKYDPKWQKEQLDIKKNCDNYQDIEDIDELIYYYDNNDKKLYCFSIDNVKNIIDKSNEAGYTIFKSENEQNISKDNPQFTENEMEIELDKRWKDLSKEEKDDYSKKHENYYKNYYNNRKFDSDFIDYIKKIKFPEKEKEKENIVNNDNEQIEIDKIIVYPDLLQDIKNEIANIEDKDVDDIFVNDKDNKDDEVEKDEIISIPVFILPKSKEKIKDDYKETGTRFIKRSNLDDYVNDLKNKMKKIQDKINMFKENLKNETDKKIKRKIKNRIKNQQKRHEFIKSYLKGKWAREFNINLSDMEENSDTEEVENLDEDSDTEEVENLDEEDSDKEEDSDGSDNEDSSSEDEDSDEDTIDGSDSENISDSEDEESDEDTIDGSDVE